MKMLKKLFRYIFRCSSCPMNVKSKVKGLNPCGNGTCMIEEENEND